MGSTRFFLANLPARTTEQDLRSLFQDYGDVEHVELKTKEQFVDSGQTETKIIAFVTVYTDDAQYCVNELNWQKLHGSKLRVSLAKESFLDRLKREREQGHEANQATATATVNEFSENSSRLLAKNTANKRRVFGEDEEIGDDEIAPELLITKKRAAHSMHNGRIVIQQEHDVKPLHIIEKRKKKNSAAEQNLDAKGAIADQKRIESLNKMKRQHQQKMSAIQQALSCPAGSQAKSVKFSDAEEEDEPAPKAKVAQLFDNDDDDDEANGEFALPKHSGRKGAKLVEMQSKQSLDQRFRITDSFVGDEGDEDGQDDEDEDDEKKEQQEETERNWQMGILEQVIGRKIAPGPTKVSQSKKMRRFDPSKEEHQKLVLTAGPIKPAEAKPKKKTNAADAAPVKAAPASQSTFYMVTDTLTQSLKTRGKEFSLLDMFGSNHDEAGERQDQLQKLGQEKIIVNKAIKLDLGNSNPFSYDSSESEDDQPETDMSVVKENVSPTNHKKQEKKKKHQINIESFFIPKNDARLKEGAKFFKSSKPQLEPENYDALKNRLKHLISKKVAKVQKFSKLKKGNQTFKKKRQ